MMLMRLLDAPAPAASDCAHSLPARAPEDRTPIQDTFDLASTQAPNPSSVASHPGDN
jgi:hypothetical protein